MQKRKSFRNLCLALFTIVLVFSGSASWARHSLGVDRYDDQIQQSVRKYWGHFPNWQFWKSQLYQESVFDPEAVSPVGARGLAQFMPATWDQIARELGLGNISPHESKYAITAGAYYMAKLSRSWKSKRSNIDRHRLAMASYNAGMGNLLKAQKACGGQNSYHQIIACLPEITGIHSKETITYVRRIEEYTFRILLR
jgi:membrane-bound lytic murein transglycosylase MltF